MWSSENKETEKAFQNSWLGEDKFGGTSTTGDQSVFPTLFVILRQSGI